jgi:hypothetical protein
VFSGLSVLSSLSSITLVETRGKPLQDLWSKRRVFPAQDTEFLSLDIISCFISPVTL